ncbi:hypothetical protein CAP36_11340 [Chitinophagaceae bacterium IBVUCB2]|nr:hypothetical protein CAP36_11340 [Chitinophagaceae bacterium IBVUCB2]
MIASLFVLSCNKNDNDDTPIEGAGLMAVNLAPETSASLTISGNVIASSLPYNSYTGGYYSIFPGTRVVDAYNFAGLAASNNVNFQSGKYYSLFLVDTGMALQQIIVEDGVDTLATTTQSYIRYINAIQSTGASPTVTIAAEGVNVINESASFTSVSDFKTINAGSINITVTNGGSLNVSRTITVESGKIYTILLSGVSGETGDKAPQIKFIVNGTADGTDERPSNTAVVTSNK